MPILLWFFFLDWSLGSGNFITCLLWTLRLWILIRLHLVLIRILWVLIIQSDLRWWQGLSLTCRPCVWRLTSSLVNWWSVRWVYFGLQNSLVACGFSVLISDLFLGQRCPFLSCLSLALVCLKPLKSPQIIFDRACRVHALTFLIFVKHRRYCLHDVLITSCRVMVTAQIQLLNSNACFWASYIRYQLLLSNYTGVVTCIIWMLCGLVLRSEKTQSAHVRWPSRASRLTAFWFVFGVQEFKVPFRQCELPKFKWRVVNLAIFKSDLSHFLSEFFSQLDEACIVFNPTHPLVEL